MIDRKLHSYGKIMTGSEIGKFGAEDEKCCIEKCNQCVTHTYVIHL